ncbi:MAG: winged helix-turn-helix transcriptional regulator [Patescibacteria group bacterium]
MNIGDQLLSEGPLELCGRSMREYGEIIRAGMLWKDRRAMEKIDYAVKHLVIRLLRSEDREELLKAYDDLRRLIPWRYEALAGDYWVRWRTCADLIDFHLQALVTRDQEAAARMKYAPEVLQLVGSEPRLSRAAIARRLSVSPIVLSRVLSILEANGLIERGSHMGRRVYLLANRSRQ